MRSAKTRTCFLTLCAVFLSSALLAQGTVTVNILSPTDDQSFLLGSPVTMSYEYSASGTAGTLVRTCTLDGAPSPVGGETRYDLAVGPHTYTVTVDDGGVIGSDKVDFTVVAPIPLAVEIASPADGASFAYGASITFDYDLTYDPALGVPTVQTTLDGAAGPADGGVLTNLAPGTHAYGVAANQNGTIETDTVTFTVANSFGKVTAGGWFLGPNKCSFGLVVMNQGKKPVLRGNLLFQDHVALLTVKSTAITGFGLAGNSAVILGNCTINREPGHTFSLLVTSVAKGKKKAHTFAIALDTGYAASGTLRGGSITVHKGK